jgi:uncharacterized Zn-binding protein involved in type VI secretion
MRQKGARIMPPAAKQGDHIVAIDIHMVIPPAATAAVPTPLPFDGPLDNGLSSNVTIEGQAAATLGSAATNTPAHFAPGTIVVPPSNRGTIVAGSTSVTINGKPAARMGDRTLTCIDAPSPPGMVVAISTVSIGG